LAYISKICFLVKRCFELEGDDDLDELALDALFRREEEAARQLHGERGAALLCSGRGDIVASAARSGARS
jgi:hypothetical protein